ncbi:MAG: DUF6285 domain-containing protein, partial [Pseudomonadales bacterium]|nr:DUF6285 domain-containing protein [Pseudomonadales bacterium]
SYFGTGDDLMTLRSRLAQELREGSIPLSDERIQAHLRTTVVNQIAIDQPNYSGFKRALSR